MSSAPQGRFVLFVLAVSGLAALATALLLEGARQGASAMLVGGATLAAMSLVGILILARAVVLAERERGRR